MCKSAFPALAPALTRSSSTSYLFSILVREVDSNTSGVVLVVLAGLLQTEMLSDPSSFASSEIDEGEWHDRSLRLPKAILPPRGVESFCRLDEISLSLDWLGSLPSISSLSPSPLSLRGSGDVSAWRMSEEERYLYRNAHIEKASTENQSS